METKGQATVNQPNVSPRFGPAQIGQRQEQAYRLAL